MSIPGAWTLAIAATQAQIREARAEIAALNECFRIFKEKIKAGAPWPPLTPIREPVNYDVVFDLCAEAPEVFSWESAISALKIKIRKTRARINKRREYIALCKEKRKNGEAWPPLLRVPARPRTFRIQIGRQVCVIRIPANLRIIIRMRNDTQSRTTEQKTS